MAYADLESGGIGWDGGDLPPLPEAPTPGNGGVSGPVPSFADRMEFGRFAVAVSEGPIRGLVDGLKSVYFDSTPALGSDGTKNMSGMTVANVVGHADQSAIEGFSAAESETSVNVKVVKATPQVRTYTTTGINRLRVRLAFPALRKITGGLESAAFVTFKIERQSASWNGGAWQEVELADGGAIAGIFGGRTSKTYTIDLPAAGPWSLRITRLTDDAPSPTGGLVVYDELWWDATALITDSRYRYPGVSVIAAAVDARRFQTIPSLTADVYGFAECLIPANYDPIARTYRTTGTGTSGGTWDGTLVTGWTNNPAWVLLTVCTNTRWGLGERIDASKIDVWSLYRAAQRCDELVNDGKGGTEPRYTCSTVLQEQVDGITLIQRLASVMDAVAYGSGNTISIIQDRDDSPVALFSASNVIDGRFSYEGTAASARHTACIVSYTDPDNGYKPSQEYIEDQAAIARYGYLPLEITAEGCTSRGQARRKGLHALITEQTQTETVTFETGLEGAVCRPGDIVQVQDWTRAGQIRAAGRIAGVASNVITLDAPVTLGAGKTYTLKCTLQDGTVASKAVSTGASTTATITLASAFSPLPIVDAQWQLVEASDVPSLYRVVKATEQEAGRNYAITALLHNPAKYAAIEAGVTLGPVTPRPGSKFPAVSGLTLNDRCEVLPDRLRYVLDATWTPNSTATGYAAEIRLDSGAWEPMTLAGASASCELPKVGGCEVRVQAVYTTGTSAWATASRTVSASSSVPGIVLEASDLARQSGNLVKNGNSEMASPTGLEAESVYSGYGRSGTKCRKIDSTSAFTWKKIAAFPASQGQEFYLEGWIDCNNPPSGGGYLNLDFLDSSGAVVGYSRTPGNANTSGFSAVGSKSSISGTAPAGTVQCCVYIGADRALVWFDDIYCERKQQAALDALAQANAAVSAAATAQAAADGKIDSFFQTTPPASASEGDLWFDTDDGNKLYTRRSGAWVVTQDSQIGAAISAAATAQGTADGKARIYYQAAAPTGLSAGDQGDLWCDTDDNFKLWAWTGSAWQLAQDWQTANAAAATASTLAGYADNLARSPQNLIKNGNSEDASPTGLEAANVEAYAAKTGTKARRILRATAGSTYVQVAQFPVAPGEQYMAQGWVTLDAGVTARIYLDWWSASSLISSSTTDQVTGSAGYTLSSGGGVAPAGSILCKVYISATTTSPNTEAVWDELYCCRKISAGMLEADIALLGVVRSPGYSAGSSGNAPTGFKLSGPAFTTTYKDGTNDANCHFELEGAANFGGYKVATVNTRLFQSISEYTTAGSYSWVCPPGVTVVELTIISGGGGGSGGDATHAGGGGGAGCCLRRRMTVTPGTSYSIVVGAAGSAGASGVAGGNGGDSSAMSITLTGGQGGTVTVSGSNFVGGGGAFVGPEGITGTFSASGAAGATSTYFQSTYVTGSGGGNGSSVGGRADGGVLDSPVLNAGGGGGGSAMGVGGGQSLTTGNQPAATAYGAGGSGGGKGYSGAAGRQGYVSIIY